MQYIFGCIGMPLYFILYWYMLFLVTKCMCEDLFLCLQNELDYFGEEQSTSPRAPPQHQQLQPAVHVASSGFPVTSGSSCQTVIGQGLRSENWDNQSKSFEFSNASSNSVHRSLEHYQIGEGGSYLSSPSMGSESLNSESSFLHQQRRDSTGFNSNDSTMDIHSDQSSCLLPYVLNTFV